MCDTRIGKLNADAVLDEGDWLESLECPLPISRSDDIPILLEKMKQKFPLKFASREVLYHFTNARLFAAYFRACLI